MDTLSFGLDPPPAPFEVLSLGIPPLDRLRSVTIKEQSLLENRVSCPIESSGRTGRDVVPFFGIFLAECVKTEEDGE